MFLYDKILVKHICMSWDAQLGCAPEIHVNTMRVERLTIVEPVPETVKPMLNKVFRSPEVEPRVNWDLSEHFAFAWRASKGGRWLKTGREATYTRVLYFRILFDRGQHMLLQLSTHNKAYTPTYYTKQPTGYCCCGNCSKDDDPE